MFEASPFLHQTQAVCSQRQTGNAPPFSESIGKHSSKFDTQAVSEGVHLQWEALKSGPVPGPRTQQLPDNYLQTAGGHKRSGAL